jgi:hypothetical protein
LATKYSINVVFSGKHWSLEITSLSLLDDGRQELYVGFLAASELMRDRSMY